MGRMPDAHDIDWLPEIDDVDLQTIMEALEAWERKDDAGTLVSAILELSVAGRDPVERAIAERRLQESKAQAEADQRMRKERSVMLRAKLLHLRDRRRAEAEVRSALGERTQV
jgi:hypothetical protein